MGHDESSGISAECLLLLFSCLPALQIVGGVTRVGVIRGSVTPSLYPLRYLHTKPTQRLEDLNYLRLIFLHYYYYYYYTGSITETESL
jgi:hypothetical protein